MLGIIWVLLVYPIRLIVVLVLIAVNALAGLRSRPRDRLDNESAAIASIIIPNWNGQDLLAQCLPSVVESVGTTPGSHQIIVIDNASADESVSFIQGNFPSVLVLAQPKNLGFAGACNIGAAAARGKYLVFLNNDMKVESGFLTALLSGFQHPDTFAVTSQIHFWDNARRREETGKTRGFFIGGALQVTHEQAQADEPPIQPVFYAGGGSSAYDRTKFMALGGFDQLYHPFYFEDTDLSYRAWKRGWPSVLNPESVVHHKHRGTIGRSFDENYVKSIFQRNATLFVWKNVSNPRILLEHALSQPKAYLKAALNGETELHTLRSSLALLPSVLRRIWHERRFETWNDNTVCQVANSLFAFKEKFGATRSLPANQQLKIVFVSPYAPYPMTHGGAVRMYNVLKRLGARHRVTLLTYTDNEDEAVQVRHLEQYCERVIPIVRDPDYGRYNRFGPDPLCRVEFDSPEMWQALQDAIQDDIDVLQIEYTQMAHYATTSRRYLSVLTEHDLSFRSLYRQFMNQPWSRRKASAWLKWLRMFNYELAMCPRFDLVLTMSELEEDFLRSYLPDVAIATSPNGVDISYYQPRDGSLVEPDTVLFLGYMRHTPNIDAMLYFTREIFPSLKTLRPEIRLTIVGNNPTKEVYDLALDPAIKVTGYVENVREYYRRKAVFVAPIRIGAGTRIKLLEAMATGIPIVTTTIGAEGIHCQPGRDLLIADSPNEFAQAVARLLADPDLSARIGKYGRRAVEQYYDWEAIVNNLERLYYQHLDAKIPGARQAAPTVAPVS